MVDVSSKEITLRTATAKGKIYLNKAAFSLIDFGSPSSSTSPKSQSTSTSNTPTMRTKKGDVLSISQIAGLMAAKQTSSLIPLCHPLSLSHLSVTLVPSAEDHSIEITCRATCEGKTGVEMEALMGVSVAGLTVWDMCKAAAGDEMVLGEIKVVEKTGGRSGDWTFRIDRSRRGQLKSS
jgi:cyclic pyranopterin phosphate synthase